ncbi:MAG TPA: DNA replication and repair protein RecF [Candidatus Saccharimonadales bacterium]|nr:DNA replication and repair protein RecF [Candidatus Saccharimonadales bacterium]
MITSLRLQHFRSYDDASFELESGVNIIVGPNASGKTNLLEAVLVAARGSSYRGRDSELIGFGQPWARLDADTLEGMRTVKLERTNDDSRATKSFDIDGQHLSRLTPQRTLPTVLFEPNHLLLLSGSPELRRTFLDDLIEQTNMRFGALRRHYKRVLAQRNALLKRQPRDLREQLFVWNVRLSELGGQIAHERQELINRFNGRMGGLYGRLAATEHGVALAYVSQFAPESYETALLHKLEASTDLDVLRGFTAYGPHRDDLSVLLDGHEAATSASRGESRTLVLALKIMELQLLEELRGARPLLLLDDVFSELDARRRQALTSFVADYQTFITTTDADVVAQHFASRTTISLPA